MLTKEEILSAQEIYMYDGYLYILPNREGMVYTLYPNLTWKTTGNESFWRGWESKPNLYKPIIGQDALLIMEQWEIEVKEESILLNQAIAFATERHAKQFRKGTLTPYILHPLEVMQILHSMQADTKLLIAGLLHDLVEDTNTTLDEIQDLFGSDVAQLVGACSEDKSKSWQERKEYKINELTNANTRLKMLVLADKLSNIRSIATDYEMYGEKLWNRFNAPKEKQAWYYSKIQDALFDMQSLYWCRDAYWEFVALFKNVFVKFLIDEKKEILYQICVSGECYYLEKAHPFWRFITDEVAQEITDGASDSASSFYRMYSVFKHTKIIDRKDAEYLVDNWVKEDS